MSCSTYNRESYIRQCLDGILRQQYDFGFEVLIYDDVSTVNTQEIIKEYQERHPDIIKPLKKWLN
ncbi:MAG: glycosyltransferase [Aequorivita sp.]